MEIKIKKKKFPYWKKTVHQDFVLTEEMSVMRSKTKTR